MAAAPASSHSHSEELPNARREMSMTRRPGRQERFLFRLGIRYLLGRINAFRVSRDELGVEVRQVEAEATVSS